MEISPNFLLKILLFNVMIGGVTHAQTPTTDSLDNIALRKAEAFFTTSIKEQSRIFNGPAHYAYGSNVGGSAFFMDASISIGTVVYEGNFYKDVPLLYDLYLDRLVSVNDGDLFSMVTDKVNEFYLLGHHFIYMPTPNPKNSSPIESGFYDLIYDGKMRILAKRVKKLQFSTNKEVPNYFNPKVTYYLERGGQYEVVGSESSFLNLFKDKKSELKKKLTASKVKFNKNPEEAMVIMAAYYESLTN